MIFVADENFTVLGVRLLEAFDPQNEIRHLTNSFPKGTPDTTWIPSLGERDPKPIIIGGDGRILKNKAECAALRQADLSFVYLTSGWTNLEWSVFAWKIIKVWPDVVRNVETAMRPTVYEVGPGNLKVKRIGETARL